MVPVVGGSAVSDRGAGGAKVQATHQANQLSYKVGSYAFTVES